MNVTGYAQDQTALHRGVWEDARDALRLIEALIERWHGAGNGRLQIWYSPRSVGGVSKELFTEISQLALEKGVGITTHWAEVQNNVDYTLENYGCLPVEFAARVGMLGKHVTLAHGIYVTEKEMDLLAETGTNICHCPVCNSKLAMGTAKVPQMLQKGINICLGNDGMPVNNTADMFREMRTALLIQRNTFENPLYPTAAEAIEMATINGAKGIMADHLVGSLEAGKQADIILVNARKPHITPLHDPVSAIVWAANGSDVDTVLIDGQVVMHNRQILTMDEEEILADAEKIRDKILHQAGIQPNHVWRVL
jgi:cytosine/adenosine deaminase-related metal-dependent hydrolase